MNTMKTSRRHFIKVSAASAFALSTGTRTLLAANSAKPLRILILGGTGFTGPFQVKYALSRGHKITVFNRGKTHPGELPQEVEQLVGDRNGQLDALKGKQWDVCIDNPTTLPAWVRAAAQILKGNVERYVFISTISVYADTSKTGPDESAPLAKYEGNAGGDEGIWISDVRTAQSFERTRDGKMVSRKITHYPAGSNCRSTR
jgi:2'-hydroxyisoflavone reductase